MYKLTSDGPGIYPSPVYPKTSHGFSGPRARTSNAPGWLRKALVILILVVAVVECHSKDCSPCPSKCKCSKVSRTTLACSVSCPKLKLDVLSLNDLPSPPESIVSLDLSDNSFERFDTGIFDSMKNLREICLHDNPYVCDCALAWLPLWLSTQSVTVVKPDDTVCNEPSSLAKHPISSLSVKEFGCPATEFASCLSAGSGTNEVFVAFDEYHDVTDDLACHQTCTDGGRPYGLLLAGHSTSICLCGEPRDSRDTCECTDNTGTELSTGVPTCGLVYLRGVWSTEKPLITAAIPRPYSTRENIHISATNIFDLKSYLWNIPEVDKKLPSDSATAEVGIYYPGVAEMAVQVSTPARVSTPTSLPLHVLEPIALSIPSGEANTLYADVDSSLDLEVMVHTGSDFFVYWTNTDVTGKTAHELFCRPGWVYLNRRCVGIEPDTAVSQPAAQSGCQTLGGKLFEPRSRWEIRRILNLLGEGQTGTSFHLGAQKQPDGITYYWESSGLEAYFTSINVTAEDRGQCVSVSYSGLLQGQDCSDLIQPLCEKDPLKCTSGGMFYPELGLCYITVTEPKTFKEAQTSCEAFSGQLIEVTSADVANFVSSYVLQSSSGATWIGLSDLERAGQFVWPSGLWLGDFAPWSDISAQGHCVVMETDAQQSTWWRATDCESEAGFVCQHPPSAVSHDIPIRLAGQSGVLSLGSFTNVTVSADSEIGEFQNAYTLTILPGSQFVEDGNLQSWMLEVQPTNSPVSLQLLVLRPTCPTGYNIIHPDCPGSSQPISICSSVSSACDALNANCGALSQYCPLSRSCLNIHKPCTCSSVHNSTVCSTPPPSTEPPKSKPSETFPDYRVISQSTGHLEQQSTLVRISSDNVAIKRYDIVAFQHNGSQDVISCSKDTHLDWNQILLQSDDRNDILMANDVFNVTGFSTMQATCALVAVYTIPLAISPSEPYKDKTNFDVGHYNFTITARNAISKVVETVFLCFQKKIKELKIMLEDNLHDYVLLVNESIVYIENGTSPGFLVGIKQGTDSTLDIQLENQTTTERFTSTCPTLFSIHCARMFSYKYAQFTVFELNSTTTTAGNVLPLTFIATNTISQSEMRFTLSIQTRIQGLSVSVNTTSPNAGDPVQLHMDVTHGSDVHYKWVLPGSEEQEGIRLTYHFNQPGAVEVVGFACNPIHCVNASATVTVLTRVYHLVIDGPIALYTDTTTDYGLGVISAPTAAASLTVDYGNKETLKIEFVAGGNTRHSIPFKATYQTPGIYNMTVTLRDEHFNVTQSAALLVTVCELPQLGTIIGPHMVQVNTTYTYSIQAPNMKVPNYTWDFGDGDDAKSSGQTVSYAYTSVGIFQLLVSVETCVGNVTANRNVDVQEAIGGLRMDSGPLVVVKGLVVRLSIRRDTGTSTTLSVNWGATETVKQDANVIEDVNTTYGQTGKYNVTVTASNAISSQQAWVVIYVIEEDEFDVVDIVMSTSCVLTGSKVPFMAVVLHKDPGSLSYSWTFGTIGSSTAAQGSQTTEHSFSSAGDYEVVVTVSDGSQRSAFTDTVCVQEDIQGLQLHVPKHVFRQANGQVSISVRAHVAKGTPTVYKWSLEGIEERTPWSDVYNFTVFDETEVEVSVIAANDVSEQEATQTIAVYEEITQVDIGSSNISWKGDQVLCASGELYSFIADVASGSHLSYTWKFDQLELAGKSISHTFKSHGNVNMEVTVYNIYNMTSLTYVVLAEEPVFEAALTTPDFIVVDEGVQFNVSVAKGSHLRYAFEICHDTCDLMTTTSDVLTTAFPQQGDHNITATVSNDLNSAAVTIPFFVHPNLDILINNQEGVNLLIINESFIVSTTWMSTSNNPNVQYHWQIMDQNNDTIFSIQTISFATSLQNPGQHYLVLSVTLGAQVLSQVQSLTILERPTIQSIKSDLIYDKYAQENNAYNFSAEVTGGPQVKTSWTVVTTHENISDYGPTFTYTFPATGEFLVIATVAIPIASDSKTKVVLVESLLTNIEIANNVSDSKEFVALNRPVKFAPLSNKLWPVEYSWLLTDRLGQHVHQSSTETLEFQVNGFDNYTIIFNATNNISEVRELFVLTVEEDVSGLQIFPENIAVPVTTEMVFIAIVSTGTNVGYEWVINNQTQLSTTSSMNHTFDEPGEFIITVIASNKVSETAQYRVVSVVDNTLGLEIKGCCNKAFPTKQIVFFEAALANETEATFEWTLVGGLTNTFKGQGQYFSTMFLLPGTYFLTVTAEVLGSSKSQTITEVLKVQDEIKSVLLWVIDDTFGFIVIQEVNFKALVSTGSNIKYNWTISQNGHWEIFSTDEEEFSHRFQSAGLYVVSVTAYNNVSEDTDSKLVLIHPFGCDPPEVNIIGSGRPRFLIRSRSTSIEAEVDSCIAFAMQHQWTVFNTSCDDAAIKDAISLPSSIETDSPIIYLPARSLDTGTYCFKINASYESHEGSDSSTIIVHIQPSPLQAVIRGGNEVTVDKNNAFTLDGTLSIDPDLTAGMTPELVYLWTCKRISNRAETNGSECFEPQKTSVVVVPPNTFEAGSEYIIGLMVTAPDRVGGFGSQKIIAKETNVPTPHIDCVSCRDLNMFMVGKNFVVKLLGACVNCVGDLLFTWSVTASDGRHITLDDTTTKTGPNRDNLVIRKGVLRNGETYTFHLNITSLAAGYSGHAKLQLSSPKPPSGGRCISLHSEVVRAVDDIILLECTGWKDHIVGDSTLSYFVYVNNNYNQWYPVYHGTKSSLTFNLSPFTEENENIHLCVQVIDALGMSTEAYNETIFVMSSQVGEGSRLDFLTQQIYHKLPIVKRSDNPKLIIGNIITLLLELNRETSEHIGYEIVWDDEFDQRRDLRRQLISEISNTSRIIYMDDVQQIGYALKLLTNHPMEIPKDIKIYEMIINILQNIIEFVSSTISKGYDGEEFVPYYHLSTVSNTIEAIKFDMVINEMQETLGANEQLHDLMQQMTEIGRNITYLMLSTQVTDEEPFHYDLGVYEFHGQRVTAKKIREHYESPDFEVHLPADLLSDIHGDIELFQTTESVSANPFIWGFSDGLIVTSHVVSINFGHSNGSEVEIHNLPDEKNVQISIARSPFYSLDYWQSIKDFLGKYLNSETNNARNIWFLNEDSLSSEMEFISFVLAPEQSLSSSINSTNDLENGATIGIELRVFGMAPMWGRQGDLSVIHLFVGVGYPPHRYKYDYSTNVTLADEDTQNTTLSISHTHMREQDTLYITITNDDPSYSWNVSVGTFLSLCKFFDLSESRWSSVGCHATMESNQQWTMCHCNHLTAFGSAVSFTPNQLDFRDFMDLDFRQNPVVISTVCCLAALVVVALVLAAHWDKKDIIKVSRIPLCTKVAVNKYEVTVLTGRRYGAGTSAHVGLKIFGTESKSSNVHLHRPGAFGRGSCDVLMVATEKSLGDLYKIHIWHDNTGRNPSWYLERVIIRDIQNDQKYYFLCEGWLSLTQDECVIDRHINVTDRNELTTFRSLYHFKSSLGFSDHHIFMSVFDRPPHSTFTRVQRVTCCATYLYLYLFANAMWFGLVRDQSEYERLTGESPLELNDVFVGLMTSLMVMPIMLIIVQLFRYTKPKVSAVGQAIRRPSTAQTVEMDAMISMSSRGSSAVSALRIPRHQRQHLILEDVDGVKSTSTTEGPMGGLHRTAPIRLDREASLELSDCSSLQSASRDANPTWWSNDGILAWPERLPEFEGESRQSSASSRGARFMRLSNRVGSGRNKRRMSITGSEMMELEEIQEVDDSWNDSGDEKPVNEPMVTNTKPKEKIFTPRTEADIEQLIQEMDDALASEELPKPKTRSPDTHSNHTLTSCTSTRPDASCASITLECASCSQLEEDTCTKHLHGKTSRDTSATSNRSTTIRHRDSFSMRRPSISLKETNTVFGPLQPSSDLISPSGLQNSNLWAWSRSTTWVDAPEYIPVGSRADTKFCTVPHWCLYIIYSLCLVLVTVSIITVLLYGHTFGKDLSTRWILSCIFSIVLAALILEPLKVMLIAVFEAGCKKNADVTVYRPGIQPTLDSNEKIKEQIKTRPIGGFALLQAKSEGQKIIRMHRMLRGMTLYLCLLLLLLMSCYLYHDKDSYRLTEHINRGFLDQTIKPQNATARKNYNFHDISRSDDMWHWLSTHALAWIHQDTANNDNVVTLKLLGTGRLRQIRSAKTNCPAEKQLLHFGGCHLILRDCYAQSSEDTGSYGEGWNSTAWNRTWTYSSPDRASLDYIGEVSRYPSGGYVHDLGSTIGESEDILHALRDDNWIDRGTRAIFLEFTQYNPNVDMFLISRISFEYPTSGGVIASQDIYSTPLLRFKSNVVEPVMIIQVLLVMTFVWLVVHVILDIYQEKKAYLKSVWSWLELGVAIGLFTSLCLYIHNVVVCTRSFDQYFDDRTAFIDLSKEAYFTYIWQCINAFVLFILMFMVCRQLRYIQFFDKYVETFTSAIPGILGCALLFVLGLLTHGFLAYLWFGTMVYPLRSVWTSISTVLTMFRGNSPYFDTMSLMSPHLLTFLVLSLCTFMFVVVFGLLLAVIQNAYHGVLSQQTFYNTMDAKDYEMVDFMMKRFKLMIGAEKQKPAFRRVKFQGLPTISSASSRSTRFSSQSRTTTMSTTSSDFSDWSDCDIDQLLIYAKDAWERLLLKLPEVEDTDRDEEVVDRYVMSLVVASTSCGSSASKGKTVPRGNIHPKSSSTATEQSASDEDSGIVTPGSRISHNESELKGNSESSIDDAASSSVDSQLPMELAESASDTNVLPDADEIQSPRKLAWTSPSNTTLEPS